MITRKFISLSLAVLLLFSSTGVTLDIHFCGNELFDYSFFGNVKTCSKADLDDETLQFIKTSCCTVDHFSIETAQDYKDVKFDNVIDKNLILDKLIWKSFHPIELTVDSKGLFYDVPPPETKSNKLYKLKESFLI